MMSPLLSRSLGFAVLLLTVVCASPGWGQSAELPFHDLSYLDTPVRFGAGANKPSEQVSVDILRHPLREKARKMLLKALEIMRTGQHKEAIEQLKAMLTKYPDSGPYAHNLLGVEYMRTEQFADAVTSFGEAALLLPHDAVTR